MSPGTPSFRISNLIPLFSSPGPTCQPPSLSSLCFARRAPHTSPPPASAATCRPSSASVTPLHSSARSYPPRRRRGLILPRCRVLLLLPIFLLLELEQSSPPSPRRPTPAAVPRFRAPTPPSPRPPPPPAFSSSLPRSPGRNRAGAARPPLPPPELRRPPRFVASGEPWLNSSGWELLLPPLARFHP